MDTTEKATSEGVVPNKLWWAESLHISHDEKLNLGIRSWKKTSTPVTRARNSRHGCH
jgi:hypothetical protein